MDKEDTNNSLLRKNRKEGDTNETITKENNSRSSKKQ